MDSGGEVLEGVAVLLAAGFDHRQHRFDETATAGTLRAEGKLTPDNGVAQGTLAGVVRRFHPFATDERPEPMPDARTTPAHADQRLIAAFDTAQQQAFHLTADRRHATNESNTTDLAVAIVRPVLEQLARHATQVVSKPFGLIVATVDQRLEIAFQMRPAPLQRGRHASTSWPDRRSRPRERRRSATHRPPLPRGVTRTVNTVNIRATNVHNQALPFSSLVGVSSAFT